MDIIDIVVDAGENLVAERFVVEIINSSKVIIEIREHE